jgi:hypothetical protein
MSRLATVSGEGWREIAAAPVGVLVIGKRDCPACRAWSAELEGFLARDQEFVDVSFGKVLLDEGGLVDFKRANPWLAEVDVLPFTQIYVRGARVKAFPGGGIERLVDRLRPLHASEPPAPA